MFSNRTAHLCLEGKETEYHSIKLAARFVSVEVTDARRRPEKHIAGMKAVWPSTLGEYDRAQVNKNLEECEHCSAMFARLMLEAPALKTESFQRWSSAAMFVGALTADSLQDWTPGPEAKHIERTGAHYEATGPCMPFHVRWLDLEIRVGFHRKPEAVRSEASAQTTLAETAK